MKDHLKLNTSCILGHPTKRPFKSVKADTPSGWTSVAVARLVLCDYLKIDRLTLDSSTHCCHACNNERCVNPEHLYFGTVFDNQGDISPELKAKCGSWDRGKRYHALTPEGIHFIADTWQRLNEMIGISAQSFYKYCKLDKVTQVIGQRPNRFVGWRFYQTTNP